MALAVEQNVSVDPRDVGGFRASAVMAQASRGASAIEQTRLGRLRRTSLVNRAGVAREDYRRRSRKGMDVRDFDTWLRLGLIW
jgi:hypothetical protein